MRSNRRRDASSLSGRLACTVCKYAKTRCDRADPICARCARLGLACNYTEGSGVGGRIAQQQQQADMARQINQLQERVAIAEAKLAVPSAVPIQPAGGMMFGQADTTSQPRTNINLHQPSAWKLGPVAFPDSSMTAMPNDFDVTEVLEPATLNLDDSFGLGFGGIGIPEQATKASQIGDRHSSMPKLAPLASDGFIPMATLSELHTRYFSTWSPALPFIHQPLFRAKTAQSTPDHQQSPSHAVLCLSHAVALVGATDSPQHTHLEARCYTIARQHLELAETAEDDHIGGIRGSGDAGDPEQIASLELVQALILLFRYELARRRKFTRAWITLGRAIRLGKLLNLHQVDSRDYSPSPDITGTRGSAAGRTGPVSGSADLQILLPQTQDEAVLEERRRTFWALYIFDSYASTRTGMPCQLSDTQIQVRLSYSGSLSHSFQATGKMPLLSDIMSSLRHHNHGTENLIISSWTAIVLMVELAFQSFDHTRSLNLGDSNPHPSNYLFHPLHKPPSVSSEPDNGFWDRHYTIVRDLTALRELLSGGGAENNNNLLNPSSLVTDSLCFSLEMNLSAVEILLHEAAAHQAGQQRHLPGGLVASSRAAADTAARRVLGAVRVNRAPWRDESDFFFRLQAPFLAWPMVMAMKVLGRGLTTAAAAVNSPEQRDHTTVDTGVFRDDDIHATDIFLGIDVGGSDDGLAVSAAAQAAEEVGVLLDALDTVEDHGGYWHTSATEVATALKAWESIRKSRTEARVGNLDGEQLPAFSSPMAAADLSFDDFLQNL